MSLSNLLAAFSKARGEKNAGNIELEMRFDLSSTLEYKGIVSNVLRNATDVNISMSINFIKYDKDKKENLITVVNYREKTVDGVDQIIKDDVKVYVIKKSISHFIDVDFAPYKIAVSRESEGRVFDLKSFTTLRAKLRLSAQLPNLPDWRFDFTLANQTQDINTIRKIRSDMFISGLTAANFMDKAPFEAAKKLEFEVEYIGNDKSISSTAIYSLINDIKAMGNINYDDNVKYQSVVYQIARCIYNDVKAENYKSRLGQKAIGVSPIGLNIEEYVNIVLPDITKYAVTDKADGERVFGVINGNTLSILGGTLTEKELDTTQETVTIFEAEMHDDILYIYDVLVHNGGDTFKLPLSERLECRASVVNMVGSSAKEKRYEFLTDHYSNQMLDIYEGSYPYEIDGLILAQLDKPYNVSQLYKFKPPEHLTIDMLVKQAPQQMIGTTEYENRPQYTLYFLFCGISNEQNRRYKIKRMAGYRDIFKGINFANYYPIQFSPSSEPGAYIYYHDSENTMDIEGRVCEFRRENGEWKLVRIRDDRDIEVARGSYFGNNIKVAESTWNSIQNPLTFEMLRGSISDMRSQNTPYFGETEARYKPANNFSSYVKNQSMSQFSKCDWIIDLAAGRGADMHRWIHAGAKNVLAVDIDHKALEELRGRQKGMKNKMRKTGIKIYTHQADLNSDWTNTSTLFKRNYLDIKNGASLVICNMAAHYFCENALSISNFVMLVDSLTKVGGYFTMTCYNGKRVFDTLGPSERIEYTKGNVLTYSIIKAYAGAEFANYGQKIQTLLGFGGGIHKMEYLVNTDYLKTMFKSRGFTCSKHCRFDEFFEKYSIESLDKYDKLDEADFSHLSLYDYITFKKKIDCPIPKEVAIPAVVEPEVSSEQKLEVIPTKEVVSNIFLNDVKLSKPGTVQYFTLVRDPDGLEVGNRITVNRKFDAVIDESRTYHDFSKIFDEYAVGLIFPGMTEKDAERKFKIMYTAMRRSNGITVIKVRRL